MLTRANVWAIAIGFGCVAVGAGVLLLYSGPRELVRFAQVTLNLPMPTSAPPFPSGKPAAAAAKLGQPDTASASMPAAPTAPSGVPVEKPVPSPAVPHFDVVRVEQDGGIVVAGQGLADAGIELLAGGRVLGEAKADGTGHFAIVPSDLTAGDYVLSLRQTNDGSASILSRQSVTVSVPAKGQGSVVVALAEPGSATKLLSPLPAANPEPVPQAAQSGPVAKSPAMPTQGGKDQALSVGAVELENGSGFYASGQAAPGTSLRLYLNNSRLADIVASAEGKWSIKIRKGLTGGHYIVRADASPDGTRVTSRAEVPFDVPVAMADAGRPATPAPAAAKTMNAVASPPMPKSVTALEGSKTVALGPSVPAAETLPRKGAVTDAVIEEVSTAAVHTGDNLWDISRVRLGEGRRYTRIYAANVTQIRDPRLIYPGQVFVLPSGEN